MIVSLPDEFSTQLLYVCLRSKLGDGLHEEEWSRWSCLSRFILVLCVIEFLQQTVITIYNIQMHIIPSIYILEVGNNILI